MGKPRPRELRLSPIVPQKQKNGVWMWKSDASSVFPPHPPQEPRAEWSRQTWLRSKGQIIVDAVCLHNAGHCLRPEAQTLPLARLSELEPRAERFKSLWSGTERAPVKTGWLFRGGRRGWGVCSPVPHHIPSQNCKHKSTVCF